MAAAAPLSVDVALVPGDVNPVIDFTVNSNQKLLIHAIQALQHDYNVTELNLKCFLSEIRQRATEGGWSTTFEMRTNRV